MDSISEWVVLGVGFIIFEGLVEPGNPLLFVRWKEDEIKERQKELARRGWEAGIRICFRVGFSGGKYR